MACAVLREDITGRGDGCDTALVTVHGVGGAHPGEILDRPGEDGGSWLGKLRPAQEVPALTDRETVGAVRVDGRGTLYVEYLWHTPESAMPRSIGPFLRQALLRYPVALAGVVLELPRLAEVALEVPSRGGGARPYRLTQGLIWLFRHLNIGLRAPSNLLCAVLFLAYLCLPGGELWESLGILVYAFLSLPFTGLHRHLARDAREVRQGRALDHNRWSGGGRRGLLLCLYYCPLALYVGFRLGLDRSVDDAWMMVELMGFLPSYLLYIVITAVAIRMALAGRRGPATGQVWVNVFFNTSFSFLLQGLFYSGFWMTLVALYWPGEGPSHPHADENLARAPLLLPYLAAGICIVLAGFAVVALYRRDLSRQASGVRGSVSPPLSGPQASRRLAIAVLGGCVLCWMLSGLAALMPALDQLVIGARIDLYSPVEQTLALAFGTLASWARSNQALLLTVTLVLVATSAVLLYQLRFVVEVLRDLLWYLGNRSGRRGTGLMAWECVQGLRDLLRDLARAGRTHLVLVGHSQGTTILHDALRDLDPPPEDPLSRVTIDLVTVGSPLQHIYARYFPEEMYPAVLRRPPLVRSWRNLFFQGDFVGTMLNESGDGEVMDVALTAARGHTDYWGSPEVAGQLRALLAGGGSTTDP